MTPRGYKYWITSQQGLVKRFVLFQLQAYTWSRNSLNHPYLLLLVAGSSRYFHRTWRFQRWTFSFGEVSNEILVYRLSTSLAIDRSMRACNDSYQTFCEAAWSASHFTLPPVILVCTVQQIGKRKQALAPPAFFFLFIFFFSFLLNSSIPGRRDLSNFFYCSSLYI